MKTIEFTEEIEAPATEIEMELAQIWSSLLNVPLEKIGRHTSFFELGGDSISAMQLVARCRIAGLEVSSAVIFRAVTLKNIAAALKAAKVNTVDQSAVLGQVYLSPIQKAFFTWSTPNKHHFNQSMCLVPKEGLNFAQVHAALKKIIEHHDMLRARFSYLNGRWNQAIDAVNDASFVLEEHSVTEQPELEERILSLQQMVNFESGPLFVGALIHFGSKQRLFLACHHLIIDLVSWRVIIEDLETLCRKKSLPLKTLSFQDWSRSLFERGASSALGWEKHLRPIENTIQRRG